MAPLVGLNLIPDPAFAHALKPLIADHLIDALEWDIDSPWVVGENSKELPAWARRLLDLFASTGSLFGHCVWLSMLTGRARARQEEWLERLAAECERRPYRQISEHMGFMSAGAYEVNTLLPVPYVDSAVSVGRARLAQFAEAVGTRVGLETMAATLAPSDATSQGLLLDDILAPGDGYVLLDVHNVFTQGVNLGLDPMALLASFPRDRVRALHVAGGSWQQVLDAPYRFDGHNGPVPPEVFPLVTSALAMYPNIEVVIYERRTGTVFTDTHIEEVQRDYRHLVELVRSADKPAVPPPTPLHSDVVVPTESLPDAEGLADYQDALIEVFSLGGTSREMHERLLAHPAVEPVRDYVASFLPRCIIATSFLVRRWGKTAAQLATEGVIPNPT